MIWILKVLAPSTWAVVSVGYWGIVLLGVGFGGIVGGIVGVPIALALWLPATALLTDWIGWTRVWPHNR